MINAVRVEDFLHSLQRFGIKPGLQRIEALLACVDNPHRKFQVIHVAGSNGKGSIAATVAEGLRQAGYTTGLYTSPHLQRYNERIQVNGQPASDDELSALVARLQPAVTELAATDDSPTEFDVGTALAFLHFAEEGVDVAVVETGLGGRLDSTNVVDPVLSIITSITYDHANVLGPTLAHIAKEKAGIIKPGRPVLLAPQPVESLEVLLAAANDQQAQATYVAAHDDTLLPANAAIATYEPLAWHLQGGQVAVHSPHLAQKATYDVGMLGPHQLPNGAVAATALHMLQNTLPKLQKRHIAAALLQAKMPGRLEIVERDPYILLDGAHNASGAEALAAALRKFFANRPVTLVCGVSQDKAAEHILKPFASHVQYIIATQAVSSRFGTWPAQKLAQIAAELTDSTVVAEPNAANALQLARQKTPAHGAICVMGSLYLVGEVRGVVHNASWVKPC